MKEDGKGLGSTRTNKQKNACCVVQTDGKEHRLFFVDRERDLVLVLVLVLVGWRRRRA